MQSISIYPGAICELQTILRRLKIKKVFLVTGRNSFDSCGAKLKLKWLFNSCDVTHFYDFQTNPNSIDVKKGVQLFNQKKCDIIVSVGGGSVIDMAKLIHYYHNVSGFITIDKANLENDKFIPMTHISIPTTAGSGAEETHFAVMYIGNIKYSVAHPNLVPDYAIIDPELHLSQTSYQKAVSGVDAIAQSMESFWSVQANEESRFYSEKALELVWNNLPNVVHYGDEIAHLKLAVGANWAGRAINIAKTTAPHALSYGFTKKIGLPHGHAVALTLAQFFDYNLKNPHLESKLYEVKTSILQIINCSNQSDGKRVIEKFLADINIETRLSKLCDLNKGDLLSITEAVNTQRLSNNPVPVSKFDIENILSEIY